MHIFIYEEAHYDVFLERGRAITIAKVAIIDYSALLWLVSLLY